MISHSKHIDLIFVILFPLVIFILVFMFGLKINYFESLILLFGLPSIFLSLRSIYKVRKVATFTLFVSIPLALIFEIVASGDHAWFVSKSILPWRFLSLVPIEDFLWMFLTTYIIIMFYEHFCNSNFRPMISKKIRSMNWLLYSIASMAVVLFIARSPFLTIPYAYLWLGVLFFLIPVPIFLSKYPAFTAGFAKTAAFFLYVHLMFELLGLRLNHWIFTGAHYLGWVSIFNLRFPIEELIFVMVVGGFAACSYYEYFASDELDKSSSKLFIQ